MTRGTALVLTVLANACTNVADDSSQRVVSDAGPSAPTAPLDPDGAANASDVGPASPSVPSRAETNPMGSGAGAGGGGIAPGPVGRDGGLAASQGGAPSVEDAGSDVGGDGARGGASAHGGDGARGGATAVLDGGTSGEGGSVNETGLRLPDGNASFDYQLGGAYDPPDGVEVVSRDRNDPPAEGLYNICYVNGFQTQPGEEDFWYQEHPDLLLRDESGEPVVDEDWGELLLDTSTEEKRDALVDIAMEWIVGCSDAGFDAVEVDNLDSYSRSGGLLSQQNNVDYMQQLGAIAHAVGLAIGQKNSTELLGLLEADFAVAEECNRWDECEAYRNAYGDLVFVIEYRREDFDRGCADFPDLSIVLRDLDVSTPSSGSYVYDGC